MKNIKIGDILLFVCVTLYVTSVVSIIGSNIFNYDIYNIVNKPNSDFAGSSLLIMNNEKNDKLFDVIVTDVYDGDTFTGNIHLFDKLWIIGEKFRMYGINTPELTGTTKAEGLKSKNRLSKLILNETVQVKIPSKVREKYGRVLAEVYHEDIKVNDLLLKENLALQYLE